MTKANLQNILNECRQSANVPGAAIAFLSGGTIEYAYSGFGNAIKKDLINGNSIFEAASLSKQVLAYVILRMVDEKILNPDVPAISHIVRTDLIGSPWQCLLSCEGFANITIRQILSHSTGLPNGAPTESIRKLLFQPGQYFLYTGMSQLMLQWIIERHLLSPWQEIADRYVFSPLNMKSSGFVWNEAWENQLVHGHSSSGKPAEKSRFLPWPSAGGLLTSISDYAIFFQELLLRMNDDRSVFAEMWRPQISRFYGLESALSPWPIAWGMGIGLELIDKETYVWQIGANPLFYNWLIGNPKTGEGLLVFTNSEPGHLMLRTVVGKVFGKGHPCFDFDEQYLKVNS
jgi:CubicO group peptidase (beta-lactamase class C family)